MRIRTVIRMALSGLLILAVLLLGYAADDPKATALQAIDRNKDQIAKVGDAIFSFAELGMQEKETSALCVRVFKQMGYKVETGISGFPTAVKATYGSGKPVIAAHTEYDAVPSGRTRPVRFNTRKSSGAHLGTRKGIMPTRRFGSAQPGA